MRVRDSETIMFRLQPTKRVSDKFIAVSVIDLMTHSLVHHQVCEAESVGGDSRRAVSLFLSPQQRATGYQVYLWTAVPQDRQVDSSTEGRNASLPKQQAEESK
ncbi:hypothetical protein RRG08_054225 [Elysia crispata]|uniref:Uncharacterized protein n=1 Tax=Elysia crispata TaxID=231223 RepID=A0AAE1CWP3_9GAST|nr:hypothetical protein RRG08_054225 [Elysia crispata]